MSDEEGYCGSSLELRVEVRMKDGGIVAWEFQAHDAWDEVTMRIGQRGGDSDNAMEFVWEDIPMYVARAFAGYFPEVVRRRDEYQRHGTPT